MREISDVGEVVAMSRSVRTDAGPVSYLQGWKPGPEDMPSMQDFNRVYGNADLLADAEVMFVSEVAARIEGYRSTLSFEDDGRKKFGIVFYSNVGSFFFVFGYDGLRTVDLYYMGIESDAARLCSKFASRFEMEFEDAYFDVRDAVIGKHGIRIEGGS
jgi:hypothetical protein